MLARFCLYGFLKNQRYFEPFLVLALLERGAGLGEVGILVAVREAVRNLAEIPSGAMADAWGRRPTMVVAFVAYPLSLAAFVASGALWAWALGMALLGVGDALRSGTHKSMIFEWLRAQGRPEDNTRVYGLTRSWSQLGSAVSIPIATAIVILGDDYALVFWATAVPWLVNLVNLATYPRALEGPPVADAQSRPGPWAVLRAAGRSVWAQRSLRTLVLEAMTFQGIYKATRDFIQPAVLIVVASVAFLSDARADTALAVGVAYVAIHGAGAIAARGADALAKRAGGTSRATAIVWLALVVCLAATVATAWSLPAAAVIGFGAVAVLYNLYRPLLVSRVDDKADSQTKATVLSIESQATSLAAVVLAPLVGFAADATESAPGAADSLWPAAAIGLLLALPWAVRRSTVAE